MCLFVECFLGCLTCSFIVLQVLLALADCPLCGMKVHSLLCLPRFDALFKINHIFSCCSFIHMVSSYAIYCCDSSTILCYLFWTRLRCMCKRRSIGVLFFSVAFELSSMLMSMLHCNASHQFFVPAPSRAFLRLFLSARLLLIWWFCLLLLGSLVSLLH